MSVKAIVTDIEGTTSDIAFVHNVLFPYAANKLAVFVHDQGDEPEVAAILADIRGHIGQPEATREELIEILLRWIETDQKVTPLKALQGLIWAKGYARGDFTGHVYADAVEQLKVWNAGGVALYVYSSGSEKAQRLLFGYSDAGDLTPLFRGYFDSRVGAKQDQASYAAIAEAIGISPADILFLSDVEAELDAAELTGMQTCLLARDDPQKSRHPVVQDFRQVSRKFELS